MKTPRVSVTDFVGTMSAHLSITHPIVHTHFREKSLLACLHGVQRCSTWLPREPYELAVPQGDGDVKLVTIGAPEAPRTRDFGIGFGGPPSAKSRVAHFMSSETLSP
jgi:hypothetical protein